MQKLISAIMEADSAELSELIQAVTHRYRELHPDWEISFLCLPKNDEEARTQIIDAAFKMIKMQ